jgi:hypothetical protein
MATTMLVRLPRERKEKFHSRIHDIHQDEGRSAQGSRIQ